MTKKTAPPSDSKPSADDKLLAGATPGEKRLLAKVLREVRHAMATSEQLAIHVDPWVTHPGAYVHVSYLGTGGCFEFDDLKSKRKRTKR